MRNEKGQFVKGQSTWNKGTKGVIKSWNKGKAGVYSEETIKKMSLAKKGKSSWNKGKKLSEEQKQKLAASHIGKKLTKESIEKRTRTRKENGYRHSEETRLKMCLSAKGERNHNWLNGKSFEPYGLEFNEDLKEVIRNRDRRKCQICEKTELENQNKLHIHHIDYNKQNNNPNNLITLCPRCHAKTNHKREYWVDYFRGLLWQ